MANNMISATAKSFQHGGRRPLMYFFGKANKWDAPYATCEKLLDNTTISK